MECDGTGVRITWPRGGALDRCGLLYHSHAGQLGVLRCLLPWEASVTIGLEMPLACLPQISFCCCGCCWPTALCSTADPEGHGGSGLFHQHWAGSGLGVRRHRSLGLLVLILKGFPQAPPAPPRSSRGSVTPLTTWLKCQWKGAMKNGNGQWSMENGCGMQCGRTTKNSKQSHRGKSSSSMSGYLDERTKAGI